MSENKNFMVSDEIADDIDKSQFDDTEYPDDSSETIIVQFETENVLIPGIIEKYMHRLHISEEEILISFMTKTENIIDFQQNINNMTKAKLSLKNQTIGEFDLNGMSATKIIVEQDLSKAGCVITVVYR